MTVQRGGVELSQHVNLVHAGIQAIADRNIHQAELARQRHRRFTTFLSQWNQTGSTSSTHNNADNSTLFHIFNQVLGSMNILDS